MWILTKCPEKDPAVGTRIFFARWQSACQALLDMNGWYQYINYAIIVSLGFGFLYCSLVSVEIRLLGMVGILLFVEVSNPKHTTPKRNIERLLPRQVP